MDSAQSFLIGTPDPSICCYAYAGWGRINGSGVVYNLRQKMMKLNRVAVLCCLVLLASAWWDKGHMLVSQIAYSHLTATARLPARDKFNQLVAALNAFTDGRSNSFAEAAVWADDIKEYGATIFDNYHFTNIPYDPDFTFKGMTQYQQDVNAVNTINWCQGVLKANKDGISFERALMARFLLHLVGDIHQPLHSTMMFNATYKTGDLGGNLIHILTPNGTDMNLHAYFDSIALDQDPVNRIERPLNDSFRAGLEKQAAEIMERFPASELEELIQVKDPRVWGAEAYKFAIAHIYAYTKVNKKITEEYQAEVRELLFRQIALGGYRLAETIATVLA